MVDDCDDAEDEDDKEVDEEVWEVDEVVDDGEQRTVFPGWNDSASSDTTASATCLPDGAFIEESSSGSSVEDSAPTGSGWSAVGSGRRRSLCCRQARQTI